MRQNIECKLNNYNLVMTTSCNIIEKFHNTVMMEKPDQGWICIAYV